MSPLRFACALALALYSTACRATSADAPTPLDDSALAALSVAPELTLGPNDVLRVGVYGHPELSSLPHATTASGTRIDGQGNLSLPLVGPVQVAGLHVSEAHEVLTSAFAQYVKDPRLDVSVIEYGARRVYVWGEVREPGEVVLDRELTLGQCLALTGGFSERADRDYVVLARPRGEDVEVWVCDGEDPTHASSVVLHPDDTLFVRRSGTGEFVEEFLPIITGATQGLTSVASLILIADRLDD